VKARVVSNDTVAVIEELKRLANTRYHGRPVSLYGGTVELPMIVTREDGRQWFPQATSLTDGLHRVSALPTCAARRTAWRASCATT
jgi:hypothetical protein